MSKSVFKVRKINEENLGDFFKFQRESLGFPVEKVAEILTISKAYLVALEENDFSSLPPDIYTRGIIASYSTFLHADPKKAIFLYEKRKRRTEKESFSFRPIDSYSKIFRYLNYRNFILLLGFGISVILIFYLIKIILPLYSQPSFLLINPSACPFDTNKEVLELKGIVQPEGRLIINGEEVLSDKEGVFTSLVFLKPGENQIRFKITNKFKKEREVSCLVRKN